MSKKLTDSFHVTTTINHERVANLLCSAFEGGSNYWYCDLEEGHVPDGVTYKFFHMELPLKGGSVVFDVQGSAKEDDGQLVLDGPAIQRGLQVMAKEYPSHLADVLTENDDSTTGDVFLQCCVFGKLIYG